MAGDITQIIDKLKNDAIERCRERILQASKKRDDNVRKRGPGSGDYGITSGLKYRHGL